MSLLQARPDVAADEFPSRGCSDLVRIPRALLLNETETCGDAVDPSTARRLLDGGGYTRLPVPAVVVYRIQAGEHSQTGIVLEASVRDYREGRIRKHEATDPARERRIDMSTADSGFEQLPVTLTHPGRDRLAALLADITAGDPRLDVGSVAECRHTVWISQDTALVRAVRNELGQLGRLYIADGHHRMAAAERYASRRSRPGSAFTLAVLFPFEQMRVLGYTRRMRRPAGYSTRELLDTMANLPGAVRVEQAPAGMRTGPGEVAVYLDGDWYRMVLAVPDGTTDARDSLDAVVLDESVLPPLADALELDAGAVPVPAGSAEGLLRACEEHGAMGFLPYPPSVEAVMAVSDADQVMPPKSTWFDPKASSGLFARELS